MWLCGSSILVAIIVQWYIRLQGRPVLVEEFTNNVNVPDSELMVALVDTRCGLVLYPFLNSLFSDLSPSGLWEPGPVLENDEIYQGYSERFSHKFPAQCQVV